MAKITIDPNAAKEQQLEEQAIVDLLLEGYSTVKVAKAKNTSPGEIQKIAHKHDLEFEVGPNNSYGQGRWVRKGQARKTPQELRAEMQARPTDNGSVTYTPEDAAARYTHDTTGLVAADDADKEIQEAMAAVKEATLLIEELRAKVKNRDASLARANEAISTLSKERDKLASEVNLLIEEKNKMRHEMEGLRSDANSFRTLKRQADEHKRRMSRDGLAMATNGLWAIIRDEK